MSKKDYKYIIAVYGSLRKGLGNNHCLGTSELLGTFNSEPVFSMYDKGSFPAITKEPGTSVLFEVYGTNDKQTMARVDQLEGVESGFYKKEIINTPYGEAFVYVQEEKQCAANIPVNSGDWKDYYSIKKVVTT